MGNHFDFAAAGYDTEFTHSAIGKRQRQMVYGFLESRLDLWNEILEINCGTGEDALWFANNGKQIIATDISSEMIKTAKAKAELRNTANIEFKTLDITKINTLDSSKKYDLIFSNFGGLNCLSPDELIAFLETARDKLLAGNGSIVMVIMSKGSIWESLFYLRKLNLRKAFRRNTNRALLVNVNGQNVPTYYYNPSFFKKVKESFIIEAIQNVAFFLPPSYLEPIFAKRPGLLNFFFRLERKFCKLSFLAGFADHYLIELKPR